MKKAFINLVEHSWADLKKSTVLIAASGGLDSTVLIHLCLEANLDFAIAHCNFKLRGAQSDADASFVRELGQKMAKQVYVQAFDTQAYADAQKISIQMAARELRYNWFDELS